MMLQAENLVWGVHDRSIVDSASLTVAAGECVGLIGPNGCGKSSLLRLLYRAVRPWRGRVWLEGNDLWRLSPRDLARRAAVLTQHTEPAFDCSVREAVMMGRLPHQSRGLRDSAKDQRIVDACLDQVGIHALENQRMTTLSGGERQRVWLARALAQEPKMLFLDEPTNHLDIRHQLALLDRVRALQCTSLIVMHDLNLAAQYCDRLYLMQAGKLVTEGTPQQVLTPANLERVYGVQACIDRHPATGALRVSCWSGGELPDAPVFASMPQDPDGTCSQSAVAVTPAP